MGAADTSVQGHNLTLRDKVQEYENDRFGVPKGHCEFSSYASIKHTCHIVVEGTLDHLQWV